MLDLLIDVHPDALTRDQLAERVGYEPTGGTFNTYLSTLRPTASPTSPPTPSAPTTSCSWPPPTLINPGKTRRQRVGVAQCVSRWGEVVQVPGLRSVPG